MKYVYILKAMIFQNMLYVLEPWSLKICLYLIFHQGGDCWLDPFDRSIALCIMMEDNIGCLLLIIYMLLFLCGLYEKRNSVWSYNIVVGCYIISKHFCCLNRVHSNNYWNISKVIIPIYYILVRSQIYDKILNWFYFLKLP